MANFKTTTRGMDRPMLIPDKEALLKMLDTAQTPEAAFYAQAQTKKRLGVTEITRPVIQKIKEFALNVQAVFNRQSSGSIWTGRGEPLTDFKSLQQFLAENAVGTIKELLKQVKITKENGQEQSKYFDENGEFKGELDLDIAVSDKAQFVRGYKLNGESIKDQSMVEKLDSLFKAWLAEKGMFYKEGQLYKVDDMGQIMKNEKGEEILMEKEEVFSRLQDDKKGFSAFLENQGLQSTVTRRSWPEPESEVNRAEDVTAALQSGKHIEGVESVEGVNVEVEPEPEHTKPGSGGPGAG